MEGGIPALKVYNKLTWSALIRLAPSEVDRNATFI